MFEVWRVSTFPDPPQFVARSTHFRQASQYLFTTEGRAKTWHGRSNAASTQRKGLADGWDDWEVSADLRECDKHPDVIRRTTLQPDIVIHSPSTQLCIVVELTVPYKSRMEQAHT
ncbi:reverse transcriptase [Elysia marginata]|uniref:Reverse transcriptase n=1 Tax=Elysia marginata TaxID=1093978 RepID=A0AAV4F6S9_9GAST|nr:reverse transcriptase [Elysia marginata]